MIIRETCPLGHTCEKAVVDPINGDYIERCAWYTNIKGKHPQSEEIIDQWKCAMSWQPILAIENTAQGRGTGAAIESFRNEMVKSNEISQKILMSDITALKEVPV